MNLRRENAKMVGKLVVIAAGMFAFGYVLIPIYKHICEMTGINILSLSERQVPIRVKLPDTVRADLDAPAIFFDERRLAQRVEQLGGGRTRVSGVARDNDLVSDIDASGTPQSFSPAAQVAFTFETAGDIVVTVRDEAGNETVFTP